jgi:RNA polymerase sigma-70 factor (ECF subfamily)
MKAKRDSNDYELLRSMLAGEEEALALLYRRRQAGIYRFALQMCGSPGIAEDVTQEVFMFLMREGDAFDPRRGSLNSFLLGVARNYVLRRLRGEQFLSPLAEDSEEDSVIERPNGAVGPLENLTRAETVETVRRAILSLPDRYREVVVLCELEDMSYVEAAEVLGCAIGTIRSRLHRARALLLEKLRPVDEDNTSSATVKSARCFA